MLVIKLVNRELLDYDPQGKTRIRFSLMPEDLAKTVDVRTSPISDRIAAINDFVEAGYEVHLNFSPVIYDTLSAQAKQQLQAEIIFLTHNQSLHERNLDWNSQAEELLWTPENQEVKYSQSGDRNLRYKRNFKGELVTSFTQQLNQQLPYCNIRYAF